MPETKAIDRRMLDSHDVSDLTFLATGYWQHVFAATGRPRWPWVYKIPAAFGYILPYSYSFRTFWPRSQYERGLQLTLGTLPQACRRRLCRPSVGRASTVAKPLATTLQATSDALVRGGERLLATHCRHKRRRNFLRMLRLLARISQHGLSDLLVPFKAFRRAAVQLQVDGATYSYRGPMLTQRKVELFQGNEPLDSFDWNDLVRSQQRMWRHGVAFSRLQEILCPRSRGMFDGRLRIADTSCLTTDHRQARASLSRSQLDLGERSVREKLRAADHGQDATQYFGYIRRHINQQEFDRLWRVDLDDNTSR